MIFLHKFLREIFVNVGRKLLRDRNQKEVLLSREGLVSALYQSLVSFPGNTLES
jgi:hypothetical protein